MTIIPYPSPNHGPRRGEAGIDTLVLHYTGMPTGAAALARLTDPEAQVSTHYLIEEDGRVFALVPEALRAWHAGVSFWAGERDINSRSIGIELVNPGHEHGYRAFPEAQMAALIALAQGILARHPIPPVRVLGHSDVAPARRQDPGELFDWPRLAAAGIGLWPKPGAGTPPATTRAVQAALQRFGYELTPTGTEDARTRTVIAAFQRHFRPRIVDGVADDETRARLGDLLAALD